MWVWWVRSEGSRIGREAQGLEKGEIFEFCCLPSGGGGSGSGGKSDQILCGLGECLLSWGVGYGDAHVIWDGGPICRGNEGFDDGVIIVYG